MTSPYSIYIPIGVTYKDYKAEYFAAYIESGSGCCVSKPQCFPEKYHQDLPIIRGRDISNQLIEIKRGIENPIEDRYPAYHFIQIAKADSFSIIAQKLRKELPKFEEKDIHYRRAIGIRIVLQGLEASFKRGFRTYGRQKILSSIMISPAKTTPVSARNYMATKIWRIISFVRHKCEIHA